ncbi:unnamed protein product [Lota lota]
MKATMYSITKVLLLLTMLASLSSTQRPRMRSCLCSSLQSNMGKNVQAINFYYETTSCDTLEIVVTRKDGRRFCLDPKSKHGRYLQRKNMSTTRRSTTPATNPNVFE